MTVPGQDSTSTDPLVQPDDLDTEQEGLQRPEESEEPPVGPAEQAKRDERAEQERRAAQGQRDRTR